MIPQDETMPVPRTMQAGQNDASTLPDRESESGQDIQLEEASSSRPAAVGAAPTLEWVLENASSFVPILQSLVSRKVMIKSLSNQKANQQV